MDQTMHVLTREQIRKTDEYAIQQLGIPGVVLMENAGKNAVATIREFAEEHGGTSFRIFCGPGNNGGDGFVIARHLLINGCTVEAQLLGEPDRLTHDAGINYRILQNMDIPIPAIDTQTIQQLPDNIEPGTILVDALLGTGFHGDVREPLATLINTINTCHPAGVVAIDVPSGLDCNTGNPSNATIRADHTVTFLAMKTGFMNDPARQYTGQVTVADIGCPPWVSEKIKQLA